MEADLNASLNSVVEDYRFTKDNWVYSPLDSSFISLQISFLQFHFQMIPVSDDTFSFFFNNCVVLSYCLVCYWLFTQLLAIYTRLHASPPTHHTVKTPHTFSLFHRLSHSVWHINVNVKQPKDAVKSGTNMLLQLPASRGFRKHTNHQRPPLH